MASTLRGAARPLTELHDVALLDLDGVVYVGRDVVPGAAEALATARARGMRLAFVTNNAARPPSVIAAHLTELGIPASPNEIVTSAQAAARYLAELLPPGAQVLVVGAVGLDEALIERGLRPVHDADGHVDAVVQGYSPDLNWHQLAEGAVAIGRGVAWVATNADPTVPSARGPLPGNGSLVAALRHATRVEPVVTGKPDPAMHREMVLRSEANRPIVVGDRLDTDIEGANAAECVSMLVLSGVTSATHLLSAPPGGRPTYLAADVSGLLVGHRQPRRSADAMYCGAWRVARTTRGTLEVTVAHPGGVGHFAGVGGAEREDGGSRPSDEALDLLRALCAAAWSDRDGENSGTTPDVHADGDAAQRTLAELGLAPN